MRERVRATEAEIRLRKEMAVDDVSNGDKRGMWKEEEIEHK